MRQPLINLYAPAVQPEMIAKAGTYAPDAVIVDLEDAVPVHRKAEAREKLATMIPEIAVPVIVRVNSEPERLEDDLRAAVSDMIAGIILPKAESVEQVQTADAIIGAIEAEQGREANSTPLILLIESALAVRHCYDLASAAGRVASVIFGGAEDADLQRDLRCGYSLDGTETLYARSKVLLDARAAKLPFVLDGIFSNIENADALMADCSLSRRLGYDGRTLAHPAQIPVARAIYAPSATEIAYYRRVVTEFEDAEAHGAAAISVNGKLIDYAMYKRACAVLSSASQP